MVYVAPQYVFLHLRAGLEEGRLGSLLTPPSPSPVRVRATDRPHCSFLRNALSIPQHGGGTSDPGECAAGHCQRHHSSAGIPTWSRGWERGCARPGGQSIPVTASGLSGELASHLGNLEGHGGASVALSLSHSTVHGCLVFASLALLPVNSSPLHRGAGRIDVKTLSSKPAEIW